MSQTTPRAPISDQAPKSDQGNKSDKRWRESLDATQYQVARCGGTEPAFTGKYWDHKAQGTYHCVCCGNPLFRSETKYDSGSGWPSYYDVISSDRIKILTDTSLAMVREEIVCATCDGHLGHRFNDGPAPTGHRYCINSASINFTAKDPESWSES